MIYFVKRKGAFIYFLLCMFVSLFFTYIGSDQNEFIDFPHFTIKILPLYIDIVFTAFFAFLLFFDPKAKIDVVSFLLILRLFVHCIPIFYVGMTTHFALNFIVSLLCFFVYLIHLNDNDCGKYLIAGFKIFFYMLCFQIVTEAFIGSHSFFENVYFYKIDMALPIGSSNALAAKIVPIFAILFIIERNKNVKFLLTVLVVIAVALTKSRSGVFGLLFVLIIALSWRGNFLIKDFFKIFVVAFLIVTVSSYFLLQSELGMLVFSDSDSSIIERNNLIQDGIALFWKHPFFGNGFYYFDLADNPHNWFVDVLMRSGFAGLCLVCAFFIKIWLDIKIFLCDSIVRGCFVAILCMLWQGLAEIVLFGYIQDIILWSIIGLMMARVAYLKNRVEI